MEVKVWRSRYGGQGMEVKVWGRQMGVDLLWGCTTLTRACATNLVLRVSTVGTMILKKGRSAGGLNVALSFDSHKLHCLVLVSTR